MEKMTKKVHIKDQAAAAGINSLSPDLLECILSLFPLKPRTRLKCISRNWHTAITNLRRRRAQSSSSSSGLVILSLDSGFIPGEHRLPAIDRESYPLTFLAALDDCTCKQVKSFIVDDMKFGGARLHPLLADSHNGLLLLRDVYRPWVYLCNPLLPDPTGLAELLVLHYHGHSQCGFFFDPASSSGNQQWKIVNFTMNLAGYDAGIISCYVYSPESNQWEEVEATLLKPPGPPLSFRYCCEDLEMCSLCLS